MTALVPRRSAELSTDRHDPRDDTQETGCMSSVPTFHEGERVTAYLNGEPLHCIVVRETFEAGDRPGEPSRLLLRRLDSDEEINRSKDAVEREAATGD